MKVSGSVSQSIEAEGEQQLAGERQKERERDLDAQRTTTTTWPLQTSEMNVRRCARYVVP